MTMVRDGRSGVTMVPPYIGYLWAETHWYLHSEEDGKSPQILLPRDVQLKQGCQKEGDQRLIHLASQA
jgi:hypothetical protein